MSNSLFPFPIHVFLLFLDPKARAIGALMFFSLNFSFTNLVIEQTLIKSSYYILDTILGTMKSKTDRILVS